MARVLQLRIFSCLLFCILCSSHTILDVDELAVQYGIEILNKPVVLNSHAVNENVLQLSSKHGQLYSCFLPPLLAQDDEKESSKGATAESVSDILDKSLNETCMTYKKGWWTYKLCHKKEITQYHVPEIGDVSGPITTLGLFSSEDDWEKEEVLQRKPSELFHSHQYINGTICDVTQKQRKTTVQYFCATKSKDEIIRIEEPATCEYIVTVHSSKLCTHLLFSKKEKTKQVNLVCSPALIEHEFNKYMEKLNKKKARAEEMALKAKIELDNKEAEKVSVALDSLKKKEVDGSGKDANKGEKLKETISSFMKGFMKVLNIKSDDIKVTTKVLEGSQDIENILEDSHDKDELDLEDGKQGFIKKKEKEDIQEKNNKGDEKEDTYNDFNKAGGDPKLSTDKESEVKIAVDNEIAVNDIEPDTEAELPDNYANGKFGKPSTIKAINDITASMIKQLEKDSEKMQHKAAKEREAMHIEFDRVRKESVKELERAKSLLHVLKSVKESTKVKSSQEHVERQLKSVQDLVDSLQDQIKLIDDKRKTVDELEEDTNKRLYEINQKIINTKTAHSVAKSIEGMTKDINGEGDIEKIITSFKEKRGIDDDEKLPSKGTGEDESDEEEEKDDEKLQEKGDYEDLPKETESVGKVNKNKPSQLVTTMLAALKNEVLKLNKDLEIKKLDKRGDTSSKHEKDGVDSLTRKDKKKESAKSLNALVDVLKNEMSNINKKMKKEKEKVSADARSKDNNERAVIKESERDAKENMEVRIRTIDQKVFDKDFDDDNVRDEVKEATKKMEETVRKQLKDAGLDFKDNIKIKIITTKDKFDQFSSGKDVKLLTDDDAADFKDLLLGFLGGGKEKASEERRQRTLEDNYNFVFNDDDDAE